jgi:hypothetical protein
VGNLLVARPQLLTILLLQVVAAVLAVLLDLAAAVLAGTERQLGLLLPLEHL